MFSSLLVQAPTHPVYNICPEKVAQALQHFHRLPASETRPADVSPSEASAGSGDQQP